MGKLAVMEREQSPGGKPSRSPEPGSAERRDSSRGTRSSFATLATEAIQKHVPEASSREAWWSRAINLVWVRWPEPGGFTYLGIVRHLHWVSGEAGFSREPVEMSALFPLPGEPAGPVPGYRVRLGHLILGGDRWWPAGRTEGELIERLEWLALQLRVKGPAYFSRHPELIR